MHRIDGPGATVDNKFTEGDPTAGVQATEVTAAWLNDIQENLMALLAAAGITPVKGNSSQLLSAVKGRLLNVQVVTATGTITKTPGATKWRVRMWGGGGQGGGTAATSTNQVSTGGGGSTGSFAEALFDVTSLSTAAAVIGAAGNGASVGADGATGGTSTLTMGSNNLTCPGGPGGKAGAAVSALPNEGGAAAVYGNPPTQTGALSFIGTAGGDATSGLNLSLASALPGKGGSSQVGCSRASAANSNAVGYASGGSGARSLISTGANNGPSGTQGLLIIEELA